MNALQIKKKIGARALRSRIGKVQIPVALGMTVVWMLLFDAFRLRLETLGIAALGFLVSVVIMMVRAPSAFACFSCASRSAMSQLA